MESFIESNKVQHEKRIQVLHDTLTIINRDRDNDIRNKSQHVCTELNVLFAGIESAIRKNTFDFQVSQFQTVTLTAEASTLYESLYRKVSEECALSKQLVRTLIDDLRAIEEHRMRQFRKELIAAHVDLNSIAFRYPVDVLVCLEPLATFMNQMAFANYHNYSDLMADLIGIVATRELAWLDRVSALSEVYEIERGKQIALLKLQPPPITLDTFDVNSTRVVTLQDERNMATSIAIRLIQAGGTIEVLINVVIMYLNALLKEDYAELNALESKIVPVVPESVRHIDIEAAFYSMLRGSEEESHTKWAIEEWRRWTKEYTCEVDHCKRTVIDGMHLWDDHFKRVAQIDALCTNEWFRLANQVRDDDLISDLNHHIDVLRTSANADILKTTLAKCSTIIDQLKEKANMRQQGNLRVLDECRILIIEEANLHKLELKHFVEQEQLAEWIDPTVFHPRQTDKTVEAFTAPVISQLNALLKNLHNWLFGRNRYLLTIETLCSDNITLLTGEMFIDTQYEMQMIAIDDVWRRIIHYAYRARFTEITQHQVQITAHLAAANSVLESDLFLTGAAEKFANTVDMLKQQMLEIIDKQSISQLERKGRMLVRQVHEKETVELTNKCKQVSCSTAAYLKHLRLFVDGGKYATEEVSGIRRALEPLLAAVDPYQLNMTQALDAMLATTISDVNEMFQSSFDQIDETTMKLKFEQDMRACLLEAGSDIRKGTQSLLRCNGDLNAGLQRVHELAKVPKCPEDFVTECDRLQGIFKELLQFLVGEGNGLKLFAAGVRKHLNFSPIANNDIEGRDDEVDAGRDGSFMAEVWRILCVALHRIGGYAEAHYSGSDQFQTAMIDCMSTMAAKLMYYRLQCDEILLQVIINYILQLDKIIACIESFYQCYVAQFIREESKQIINICESFKSKVIEDHRSLEQEYQQLHNKLMPLHGHPRNSDLLEDLRRQLRDFHSMATDRQLHLNEAHIQYEKKVDLCIDCAEQVLTTFTNSLIAHHRNFQAIFRDDEHVKLEQHLSAIIGRFQQITRRDIEHKRSNSEEQYDSNIIMKLESIHYRKGDLKMYSPEISEALKLKWEQATNVIAKHQHSPITDQANVVDTTTAFRDVQATWLANMTKVKYDYGALEMGCEEWLDAWNNDIGEINALYALKYEISL